VPHLTDRFQFVDLRANFDRRTVQFMRVNRFSGAGLACTGDG